MSGSRSAEGSFRFAGACGGAGTFTFDRNSRTSPNAVLVVMADKEGVVLVQHPVRGWEIPGGKVEENELPISAAIREVYEETGIALDALEWIAQYEIAGGEPEYVCKWVYYAAMADWEPFSPQLRYETIGCRIFKPWPVPAQVQAKTEFSPFLKDAVYEILYKQFHPERGEQGSGFTVKPGFMVE